MDFYPWAAAQILAGCNTDSLYESKQNINFVKLCRNLIPLLESRHANESDYARAKAFLRQALEKKCIQISDIETIQRPATHIGLGQTVLYKLAKQINEPKNPNWAIDIHRNSRLYHVAIPALIGFGCGVLTFIAYTWWNEQEDTETDDKSDEHTEEISD